MKDLDPELVRCRFIEVMGSLTFNRLVDSVAATKEKTRLRYWQEQIFSTFASVVGIRIAGFADYLEVFADVKKVEIPREPISKEEFLRRMEANPYDNYLGIDETPPEWMAAAWDIDRVREELSYGLAREVSKTGSLCRTDEYLQFLSASLSVDRQLELFDYIVQHAGRESEFRPEFERAFPHSASLLPPALPSVDFENNLEVQEPRRRDNDIPF